VQILGNEYLLSSQAGEGQVRRSAAHLNARIEEVLSTGKPSSTMAAVVLAALNLTHELLQLKDRHERIYKEIEASSERLLDRIQEQSK
jgi:cell division protein ZapA (FtsZ GTPase activity inhibitor)